MSDRVASCDGIALVYVAHPVNGDIPANLARARRWLRWLVDSYPGWSLSMPWLAYVETLEEGRYRERGLRDDLAAVRRCDGIVLVGGRISPGMALELAAALEAGRWVLDLTALGDEPPAAPLDPDVPHLRDIQLRTANGPRQVALFRLRRLEAEAMAAGETRVADELATILEREAIREEPRQP